MGVFAFALNAVAQIDTVHGVVAAFCVGVGTSGPQVWLDLFGSPFDAYSVQRFWGVRMFESRCARSDRNTYF